MKVFHSSVEGAQHGPKGLDGFLKFAKDAGAVGCQPSNFMLEDPDGGFLPASTIRQKFADAGLKIDGVSAHCPFWVHTSAWTGTPTIRPFIPPDVARKSRGEIEQWAGSYILRLLDLCAELGVEVVPMFWGVAFGLEVASGYPWGMWSGGAGDLAYDLIAEGKDRFISMTSGIRKHANQLDIVLAHEIHPGTAAMCANDFMMLVKICMDDRCLGVNADPSHCWEGEGWSRRFELVGDRVVGCHMKNHYVRPGHPLRCMAPDWPSRTMQFTALDEGGLNLVRYTELMLRIGYPQRYCRAMGTDTAPLVVEAEAAYENLDAVSARGIVWVRDNCCFDVAEESFEKGMGAPDDS